MLDGPTLPIVAEGDEEPNDSFMAQLIGAWGLVGGWGYNQAFGSPWAVGWVTT